MSLRIALTTYAMNCGGMETFILRLGSVLREAGHEVDVITTDQRGAWFGKAEELGLRAIHYGPEDPTEPVSALAAVIKTGWRLARGRYDVVFLNHARYAQAALGILSGRTAVVPILHNTFEGIFTVGCSNQRRCNVVVAPGPYVAELAAPRLAGPPVIVIPHGVDIPTKAQIDRRRRFGLPLRLLFVGRLEHGQKGVLFLPDILKGCLDRGVKCVLEVVGDGPDRPRLEERLVELKVDAHCRFTGRIDEPAAVYERFLDSHVLLFPSYFEGFPIVPLEAQACGCVPVASRLRGITDYAIADSESGLLVTPGDTDGFVAAISSVCEQPDRWAAMSAAAYEMARRRFSVEAMGAAYLQLISDLQQGRYPRPVSRRKPSIDLSLFSWRDCIPARAKKIKRAVSTVLRSASRLPSRRPAT